jgi:hypothetical protein
VHTICTTKVRRNEIRFYYTSRLFNIAPYVSEFVYINLFMCDYSWRDQVTVVWS